MGYSGGTYLGIQVATRHPALKRQYSAIVKTSASQRLITTGIYARVRIRTIWAWCC